MPPSYVVTRPPTQTRGHVTTATAPARRWGQGELRDWQFVSMQTSRDQTWSRRLGGPGPGLVPAKGLVLLRLKAPLGIAGRGLPLRVVVGIDLGAAVFV